MQHKLKIDRWLARVLGRPGWKSTKAGETEDRFHNVDLIGPNGEMIQIHGRWQHCVTVAIDHFELYWDEFTVRSGRPDPKHTVELDKLRSGRNRADWMFYFWLENDTDDLGRGLEVGKRILSGTLVDLELFAPHVDALPFGEKDNRSISHGSFDSTFRYYQIDAAAGKGCVIDHSYADESLITWKRRQLVNRVRATRPSPLPKKSA